MALTPFEQTQTRLTGLILGMAESLSVNHMCLSAEAYEAEVTGDRGAPPLEMVVDVSLMWGRVSEFSQPGVH